MVTSESDGPGGSYRHQDGQALFAPGPDNDPHPQWRLPQRVPDEWSDEDVRVLWGDATPVDFPLARYDAYSRYHQDTNTVIIADYGFISTVYQLERCEETVRKHVLEQVSNR